MCGVSSWIGHLELEFAQVVGERCIFRVVAQLCNLRGFDDGLNPREEIPPARVFLLADLMSVVRV